MNTMQFGCALFAVALCVCAGRLVAEPPKPDAPAPAAEGVKPLEHQTTAVPLDPPVRFRKLFSLEGEQGQGSYHVTFSPDGKLLAACRKGAYKPYDAVVWDVKQRKVLRVFPHAQGSEMLSAVAFVPPGDRLVTSRLDLNKVFLWDVRSGRLLDTLDAGGNPKYSVTDVAAFPDGRRVLCCASTGLIVWDIQAKTHTKLPMDEHVPLGTQGLGERPRYCYLVAFTVDGTRFAATVTAPFFDTRILLWDAKTCQVTGVIPVRSLAGHFTYAPDGRYVVTHYYANANRQLGIWDTVSKKLVISGQPFDGAAEVLTYTRDGKYLLITGRHKPSSGPGGEPHLGVWDAVTGQLVNCIERDDGGIDGLAVSPNNKLLAIGGHDIDIFSIEYAVRSDRAPDTSPSPTR